MKNKKKAPFKYISVTREMYDEAAIGLKRGGGAHQFPVVRGFIRNSH